MSGLKTEQQDRIDYLTEWVSARIDELTPGETGLEPPIRKMTDELDKAAVRILQMAPSPLAYSASKTEAGENLTYHHDDESRVTTLECPNDYLRFLRIVVDAWKRPLHNLTSVHTGRYRQTSNRFFNANRYKPMACLIPDTNSGVNTAIELHPSGRVLELTYVPRLAAYDIPEILEDAFVWLAASRTLTILREPQLSQTAMQNVEMALQQNYNGMYGEEPALQANRRPPE